MSAKRFRFSDISIRSKVMIVTCLASVVALLSVAGGLYLFELRNFRQTFERELRTLSRIMADNCAPALAFNDAKTANEVLAPLGVKREIKNAAVINAEGEDFAVFGEEDECPPPQPNDPAGVIDRGSSWTVVEPVMLDGKRIGTFFMDADYAGPRGELQRVYLSVTGTVLAASLLVVVLLTMMLQRFITRPIRLLASASEAVARDRDYSVRVTAHGTDELGQLTLAFNHMLSRIQEQDLALHDTRGQLQVKIGLLEREIKERHRAEEALRVSQQKLVETSRFAGMAEVATGVLHNVGNVLNSVNVSAGIVLEKLRNSKAPKLGKAAALLTSQNGGLADYLTNDPNGQKLPGYFAKLGEFLVIENEEILREVDQLGHNIEHIKEVVAMQQNYAKVSGVFEHLPAERLVEDAIAMNIGAFERHGVVLVRQFSPAPLVLVDRHKVLQILINLIRNAKYALDDGGGSDKRMTISIAASGDEFVRIEVADNGIGISPENLTRIFAHGFTTKKDGHGFGLHSGANAAREIGGCLSAQSAGLGRGATFTLDLPVASTATHSHP